MDSGMSTSSPTQQPSTIVVHGTLVLVQLIFGAGGVIAALGLPSCNPFAFALYRELTAGIILVAVAIYMTKGSTSSYSPVPTNATSPKENSTIRSMEQGQSTTSGRASPATGGLVENGDQDESKLHKRSSNSSILSSSTSSSTLAWLPWHFSKDSGHKRRLTLLGLCIFGNQAFVIVGLKLAGPVACAVWQPSQPIMTAAICMLMQWEPFHAQRVLGVLLAFAGCAIMVIMSSKEDTTEATTQTDAGMSIQDLLGNCFFFMNCLCTALYVILSKPALQKFPSLFVTAWSYNIAAMFMAVAAWVAAQFDDFMHIVCPDCGDSIWKIPSGAYFALFYYIIFVSVLAYAIFTWANQFATGTLVMGYTVLQPVTAATMTVVLLFIQAFPSCDKDGKQDPTVACLDPPGWGTLVGMLGVFGGLSLVIASEPKPAIHKKEEEDGGESEGDQAIVKTNLESRPSFGKRIG